MRRSLWMTLVTTLLTSSSAFAHTVPYPHMHDEAAMWPFAAMTALLLAGVAGLLKTARTGSVREIRGTPSAWHCCSQCTCQASAAACRQWLTWIAVRAGAPGLAARHCCNRCNSTVESRPPL